MSVVPLVDLARQHHEVADDVATGWAAVIADSAFVGGKHVAAFEEDYAAFIGVDHCVGVANGTDALELALRATGVGAGDEVIVPANTFCATAEAVCRAGASPVFVDCEDEHLLIDPFRVAESVGPRTRAVIPVHLYGQVAAMRRLEAVTRLLDVAVIEDAAQAQGARQDGHAAGTFGVAAATSFYPGKNLGAYGDAGAVMTSDEQVARAVRLLGAHGSERRYVHEGLGFNSRLDGLQAVVLRAKLARLDQWNEQRRAAAARYDEMLADLPGVRRPSTAAGNTHVWHLYVIRVDDRDAILERLNHSGIGAAVHYPVPVHLQPAFVDARRGDCSTAERAAKQILSLPLFPGITVAQQEQVVAALRLATGARLAR